VSELINIFESKLQGGKVEPEFDEFFDFLFSPYFVELLLDGKKLEERALVVVSDEIQGKLSELARLSAIINKIDSHLKNNLEKDF
jgi:hypothetical protein